MARRVFFSFHYQNDIWRVNQVRNSWVTKDRKTAGFWDAAEWESVKRGGDRAIKNWINDQMSGTSVTVVLIGAETATRKYVNYEIQQSHINGKGMLGIYLHNLKDQFGFTSYPGANPFSNFYMGEGLNTQYLSSIYPTYDWVSDNGYHNFAHWIELAAQNAERSISF